jgi:hypothetical protein
LALSDHEPADLEALPGLAEIQARRDDQHIAVTSGEG